VPPGTTKLLLHRKPLPLPHHDLRKIVMFGDTGCRIKHDDKYVELQDCNDKDAWPYAKVAKHAADEHPDLVIHVGDYAYRESRCPSTRNCAGPWGYGYDSWKADFFEPSERLFESAPWIMVRGNHEDCDRAGEGWFRFLDRAPVPKACIDLTGFYVVKLPDLGFVVMDNAKAPKEKGVAVSRLHQQFHDIVSDIPQPAWLLTHRPLNALHFDSKEGYATDNDIGQSAIGEDLPDSVKMIVSGHVHIFEALDFAGARAPQLVVGTGGDNLEDLPPQRSTGVNINGAKVADGLVFARFGYTVWEKGPNGWNAKVFDDDGRQLASCTLVSRTLACKGKLGG
jgi:predicted phosphodiesterase